MITSKNSLKHKTWHKKARWMLKKVILNPPTNSNQMRNLCNTVVERRFGSESPSTMIVKTALDLWEDPNLVNALQNNPIYRNARERISRTAGHILPSTGNGAENLIQTRAIFHTTQQAITSPLQQVLQCNVCGLKLHCLHNHNVDCATPTVVPVTGAKEIEEEVEEFRNFTQGTIGRVPEIVEDSEDQKISSISRRTQEPEHEENHQINWDLWFGPLVLATFATFGLVFGVWNGEILVPRLRNLTSRAVLAISAVMRVSDNLLGVARM